MAVNIPTTSLGCGDVFIDDIVKVYIDRLEQIQRHGASAPLAVHATMRPFTGDKEPFFRREQLSLSKLLAEGTPKEIQMILGWLINTRLLTMSLPNDKYLS